MMIVRVAEAEIGAELRPQVQALLQASFAEYPSRTYFKLPPHFRYLAMRTVSSPPRWAWNCG